MKNASSAPDWLASARQIAESRLWPLAQDIDRGLLPVSQQLRLLADAGLMDVNVPASFGGKAANTWAVAQFMEALASGCGVTTFVMLQHITACALISGSTNDQLKADALPGLGKAQKLATVGFSQVRRAGTPMVRCVAEADSYRFDGVIPWSTGWGLAQEIVIGGTLDDGRLVFALAPTDNPGMTASGPMPLCAMAATSTVSVTLRNVKVDRRRHIKTITQSDMALSDERGLLIVAALSHGVTIAALRVLRQIHAARPSASVQAVTNRAQGKLTELQTQCAHWSGRMTDPDYGKQALTLRARSIQLSVEVAHAAVIAAAGSANDLSHPAQRVMREAMLYSLTAQTRQVQAATLDLLLPDAAMQPQ